MNIPEITTANPSVAQPAVRRLNDFMCVCSPESKKEAEACLRRVCEDFGCEPASLLSTVVYALTHGLGEDYIGTIDGIMCDMWCGISVSVRKSPDPKSRYEAHASILVQCDEVEHGIARAWELALQSTKDPEPDDAA